MKINCNVHVDSYRKNMRVETDDEGYSYVTLPNNKPLGLNGVYTFSYDYPLSTTAEFKHTLKPSMTARDILVFGRDDYKRIYRQEDADVGKPTGHIPGMLNRDESEGRYGIWGHDIGDLYFEEISINTKKKKKSVDFGMGS